MTSYGTLFSKNVGSGYYNVVHRMKARAKRNIERVVALPLQEGEWAMALKLMSMPYRRAGLKTHHIERALGLAMEQFRRKKSNLGSSTFVTVNDVFQSPAVVLNNLRDGCLDGSLSHSPSLWLTLVSGYCELGLLSEAMDTAELAIKCCRKSECKQKKKGEKGERKNKCMDNDATHFGLSSFTIYKMGALMLPVAVSLGRVADAKQIASTYMSYEPLREKMKEEKDDDDDDDDDDEKTHEKYSNFNRSFFALFTQPVADRAVDISSSHRNESVTSLKEVRIAATGKYGCSVEHQLKEVEARSGEWARALTSYTSHSDGNDNDSGVKLSNEAWKGILLSSSNAGRWTVALHAASQLPRQLLNKDDGARRAVLNAFGTATRSSNSRKGKHMWQQSISFFLESIDNNITSSNSNSIKDQLAADLVFSALPVPQPEKTFTQWARTLTEDLHDNQSTDVTSHVSSGSSNNININEKKSVNCHFESINTVTIRLLNHLLLHTDDFMITSPVAVVAVSALLNAETEQENTASSNTIVGLGVSLPSGWQRALLLLRNSPLNSREKHNKSATQHELLLARFVMLLERYGPSAECREAALLMFPHIFPKERVQRLAVEAVASNHYSAPSHNQPQRTAQSSLCVVDSTTVNDYELLREVKGTSLRLATPHYFSKHLLRKHNADVTHDAILKKVLVVSQPGDRNREITAESYTGADPERDPRLAPVDRRDEANGYAFYGYGDKKVHMNSREVASPYVTMPKMMYKLNDPTRTWRQSSSHSHKELVRKWNRNTSL